MKFLVKIFLILFVFSGLAHAKQCIIEELDRYDNSQKFDLENYNKLVKKNTRIDVDKHGNKVENQPLGNGEYRQFITILDTPYLVEKRYDANGSLYSFSRHIHDMEFGKSKSYDKKTGTLTIYDMDKDYKFSLCDLIKKMASEYSINIEDKHTLYKLSRTIDEEKSNRPIYLVVVHVNPNPNIPIFEFKVDGTTGEILKIGYGDYGLDNVVEASP